MNENGVNTQLPQEMIIIEEGNGGTNPHESPKSKEVIYTKDSPYIQCEKIQTNFNLSHQNHECIYIMENSKKRFSSVIQVNADTKEILLITKEAVIIQKVAHADIIGIATVKNNLQGTLTLSEDDLQYNDLIRLASIPKYQKKRCVCCSSKCSEVYHEREVVVRYLLMSKAVTDDFMRDVYSASELNELIAKNRKKKMLLFVNPMSGTKNSLKVWNRVEPIFKLASIDLEVVYTERFNHAYDVVMELDYKKYDGIITCSGDGIIHEIMNAIFHRSDSKEFREKIIIGALPGGSANGFCAALNEYSKEVDQPETNAYLIIKGNHTEMDLQEMEIVSKKTKIYSFLSLTWSIVADIDLESEVCRCCGMFRTIIWGLIRMVFLRKYFGALYYLPEDSTMNLDDIPSINEPLNETKFVRENDQFNFFLQSNTPFIGQGIRPATKAKINDGYGDLVFMKDSTSNRCSLINHLLETVNTGEYFDKNGKMKDGVNLNYVKTNFFRLIPKKSLNDSDDVNVKHEFEQFYSIDGERYPIEPIQCKTLRRAIRVFSLVE